MSPFTTDDPQASVMSPLHKGEKSDFLVMVHGKAGICVEEGEIDR